METIRQLRDFADHNLYSESFLDALHVYSLLAELQPQNLEVRLRIADTFLALGEIQKAAVIYTALARHASNCGYPLLALVALKILSTLEPELTILLNQFAELYSVSSSRLGQGVRITAPDPDEPLPQGFQIGQHNLVESLYQRAETAGLNYSNLGLHYPDHLAPVPLLSLLDTRDLFFIIKSINLVRVRAGALILSEGEPGHSFYILARGDVRIEKVGKEGEQIQLARLFSGAVFGEMALLSQSPRTASVIANTDSDLLQFDCQGLSSEIKSFSGVARALSTFTQERLVSNLLSTASLFKPLDPNQRIDLMRRFIAYDTDKGTVLIRQGEPGRGLFIILRGNVEVTKVDEGKETLLATLSSGDVFGEISLLHNEPASATVRAQNDSTVLFLARDYFQRLIQAVPEIRDYIHQISEERLLDMRLSVPQSQDDLISESSIEILI